MHRTFLQYLEDILDAIGNIEDDTNGISFDEFIADRRRKDAVIRNFEIIGEATKSLPTDIKEKYSNIEWKKIMGLRDILIHAYFGVKPTILWDNIKNKLPSLKREIQYIIMSEESRE